MQEPLSIECGQRIGSRPELPGIQYLRAIAAILVLLNHSEKMISLDHYFGKWVSNEFFRAGHVGVDLFFVLSGFIMVYVSYPRSTTAGSPQSAKTFLARRFVRIMPFLWFVIVVNVLLRIVGRGNLVWNDYLEYLRTAVLWPIGDLRPGAAWTLRHEMLFYMMFAVGLNSRFGQAILFAFFLSPVAWWWTKDGIRSTDYPWGDFLFWRQNLEFGAGYLFGVAHLKRWIVIPRLSIGFVHFIVIGALFLIFIALTSYNTNSLLGVCLIAAICTSILAISLAVPSNDTAPLHRVGKLIGDASYAIYLTHDIFLSALCGFLSKKTPGINLWVVFFAEVGLAMVAGIVIHLRVEKPLIAYVKRLDRLS